MTLQPLEYAFLPNEEHAEYGLLLCEDDDGEHWTLRGDPELVRMLADVADSGASALADLEVGGEWERRRGWPDEWDVAPA